jgi:hypothetical protein
MRSGVINCHILSIYYGISGKLLASTHPNYPMVEFPNFATVTACPPEAARGQARRSRKDDVP